MPDSINRILYEKYKANQTPASKRARRKYKLAYDHKDRLREAIVKTEEKLELLYELEREEYALRGDATRSLARRADRLPDVSSLQLSG